MTDRIVSGEELREIKTETVTPEKKAKAKRPEGVKPISRFSAVTAQILS